MVTKGCKRCGRTLPATIDNFYRDRSRPNGLSPWCKQCTLAYASAHRRPLSAQQIADRELYRRAYRMRLRDGACERCNKQLTINQSRYCSHACRSAAMYGKSKKDHSVKRCPRCGLIKPAHDFNQRRRGGVVYPDGLCKPCHSQYGRDRRLKRDYGINGQQEYEAILTSQGGVCELCKAEPNGRKLSIEHDHATGVLRGLTHQRCNTVMDWIDRHPNWKNLIEAYLNKAVLLP